jgi:nucleotide-binding universal stress UspA family protein
MALYTHLLVPTDGSAVAAKAFQAAVTFAAESGAKVTGYYAIEDMNMHHVGAHLTKELIEEFERRAREAAEQHVAEIGVVAKAAGVHFDSIVSKVTRPHEGIIEAAKKCGADIIFMASHGHRGLTNLVVGSVTQKVLSHSTIPVLVFR